MPPPLFWGFVPLALFQGVLFAVLFGLFMGLAFVMILLLATDFGQFNAGQFVFRGVLGLGAVAGGAVLAGVMFGLFMAAYSRWKIAKLGLPRWHEYPSGRDARD